jgi:hypothetical protein
MTTSGVTTTQMTRNTIVAAAMRKCGALARGQTPTAEDYEYGTEALNNLVAEFQTLGMPLWARKTLDIPMLLNQESYTIGVGQTINSAFPLKITQAWNEPTSGGGRQDMEDVGIYDFELLPLSADSAGTPCQYCYQPNINYGVLRIWPAPDATAVADRTLTIAYTAPFDTFVSAADTPYFPREWNNALIYGLAVLIAPEFGVPLNDRSILSKEAKDHLTFAEDFGLETASITFSPQEN